MFEHETALSEWLHCLANCPLARMEASVRLSARGISGDRLLVSIERINCDWDRFQRLCASMQLAEEHLAPLNAAFHEANQVGFEFEVDRSRVVYKGPGLLRGPSHTTQHAGPHRAIQFLAVSFCQIVNRLTNPSCVGYAIDSASCTAWLDDITHAPLLLKP